MKITRKEEEIERKGRGNRKERKRKEEEWERRKEKGREGKGKEGKGREREKRGRKKGKEKGRHTSKRTVIKHFNSLLLCINRARIKIKKKAAPPPPPKRGLSIFISNHMVCSLSSRSRIFSM